MITALLILLGVAGYCLFALIVALIAKRSKSKRVYWCTIAGLIVLPTWDVLIALLIFIPSSLFWSGNTINKHITTDTMAFDYYWNTVGVQKNSRIDFFLRDIKYAEVKVKKANKRGIKIPEPGIYRYWLDDRNEIQFKRITNFSSRYLFQKKKPFKVPGIPIKFYKTQIIENENNQIIASRKNISVSYLGIGPIPFFNYLNWHDQIGYAFGSFNNYTTFNKIYSAIN